MEIEPLILGTILLSCIYSTILYNAFVNAETNHYIFPMILRFIMAFVGGWLIAMGLR